MKPYEQSGIIERYVSTGVTVARRIEKINRWVKGIRSIISKAPMILALRCQNLYVSWLVSIKRVL